MRNVQRRVIAHPPTDLAWVVDALADPDATAWPCETWPRLVLDDGLRPGSRGGHGPIRYAVEEHDPGRRLRAVFSPEFGLVGWHELQVRPHPRGSEVVHTIRATTRGRMRVLWPLVVRWLHEALMADLFDNVERRATGRLEAGPARWSPWVRFARRSLS